MSTNQTKNVYGIVYGKVQGVFFRQTFIIAAAKRNLVGGATNDKKDDTKVSFTICGSEEDCSKLIGLLKSGNQLNSIGAKVSRLEILMNGLSPQEHEYNTFQKDRLRPEPHIEYYV